MVLLSNTPLSLDWRKSPKRTSAKSVEIRDKNYITNPKDSCPEEIFQEWRLVFEKHFEEHFVVRKVVTMQT